MGMLPTLRLGVRRTGLNLPPGKNGVGQLGGGGGGVVLGGDASYPPLRSLLQRT